jgi:hypothetical protein
LLTGKAVYNYYKHIGMSNYKIVALCLFHIKMSMLWPAVLSLLSVPQLTAVRVLRPEHSDILYRALCDVQNAVRMRVEMCHCWSQRFIFWSAVFRDVTKGSGKSLSRSHPLRDGSLQSRCSVSHNCQAVCTSKHKERPPPLVSTSTLWTATSPGQCSDRPLRFQKCSKLTAVGVEFSWCCCTCCFLFDATVTFKHTVPGL